MAKGRAGGSERRIEGGREAGLRERGWVGWLAGRFMAGCSFSLRLTVVE